MWYLPGDDLNFSRNEPESKRDKCKLSANEFAEVIHTLYWMNETIVSLLLPAALAAAETKKFAT